MKILQLNITSINNSLNALEFYQERNNYDLITLQETDTQEKYLKFKNWKTKSHTGINNKKQGYGVATFLKNDIKNIFRDDLISDKLECIWNELLINNKRTLMGNIYIPPNNHEMINILDYELEKHKETPLILLGDFNARHPLWDQNTKKPNKNGKLLADLIDRHNLTIKNDSKKTYTHPNGQSTIDLVLTRNIENVTYNTTKLDLITTLHQGIEVTIKQEKTLNIQSNIRFKTKDANWTLWKQSLSTMLDEKFKSTSMLEVNDIDNTISLLTETITECATKNLGIVKESIHSKNWWTKELTTTYENHKKLQKKFNYRSTETNQKELKKRNKALKKLINESKAETKKVSNRIFKFIERQPRILVPIQ